MNPLAWLEAQLAGVPLDPRSMADGMGTAPSEGAARLGSNFLPVAGDLVGLAQDAEMLYLEPESRTPINALMAMAGVMPFFPSLSSRKRIMRDLWNSKIVDVAGNPDVLLHGTNRSFDKFSEQPSMRADQSALGYFFTRNADEASFYAKGEGANVRPSYLDIRYPYEVKGRHDPVWQKATNSSSDARSVREALIADGYDGMLTPDGEVVAFSPDQIRSVFEY